MEAFRERYTTKFGPDGSSRIWRSTEDRIMSLSLMNERSRRRGAGGSLRPEGRTACHCFSCQLSGIFSFRHFWRQNVLESIGIQMPYFFLSARLLVINAMRQSLTNLSLFSHAHVLSLCGYNIFSSCGFFCSCSQKCVTFFMVFLVFLTPSVWFNAVFGRLHMLWANFPYALI